jgi:asparagine synthase (glutamine-hydrolysing)
VSVQFGRWNLDGRPADREYLARATQMVAPYGPDGGDAYIKDSVGILYRAFHTTKESRKETQPFLTPSGAVLTWDGRLDNRSELIREFRDFLTAASSDVSIVAAAYERWGTACFEKLLGDWALCVWNPKDQSLTLAKDPIGTRPLYYALDEKQISWSTILDPLVLLAGQSFALEEEYIAGWLSFFPATHLTPYVGIHSVPPSSSVLLRPGKHMARKYWEFDPAKRTRYRTDGEYEEHFRTVFAESIRRRLRSDCPILAELSGGVDSSSIVCMADTIIARGAAETPRLDTVSYYDDSEPNWNERPYFTRVEEKRGRTGGHIDVASQEMLKFAIDSDRFAVHPGSGGRPKDAAKEFAACMTSQGNRVVLSGIGGDEVMGGVPTATPELEDLLARGHFRTLAQQLSVWALNMRKPWFYLLFEAARGFFPPALVGVPKHKRPAPWLKPDFVQRNRSALRGYETRVKLFGPLPSFQKNVSSLHVLQRQLACDALSSDLPREKRYPYLDLGLLEFIFAAPREQLVRPGHRRSLMRRALVDIVPEEILNRKRKAYIARSPLAAISADWTCYSELTRHMASGSLGVVDTKKFLEALQNACRGQAVSTIAILRTLGIERWLRCTALQNVIEPPGQSLSGGPPTLADLFAEQK